ncbi:MAG: cobalamin biosynthesis protein CobD [Clostridia bacterium]|nr:cobalamin biosynthesis protein CobD [Clostridia bacterium]
MPDRILALLIGFGLDLILGDPEWLYHPVRLIGKYISFAENRLRARGGDLRRSALLLTGSTLLVTGAAAALMLLLAGMGGRWVRLAVSALLCWMGIAVKSMAKEAHMVRQALERGIDAGRKQVARIVGRDTGMLSRQEIVKAAVETVAENTADGVVSPLIYAALGGPVLLWVFKAASTLDSMVGYRDEKYRDIGWSSARLDDVLNYIPARITALLMCAAAAVTGLDAGNGLRIVMRDHANHLSPNCAWPESAAAGSLHIQLGGTHTYFGKSVYKPTIGDDDREAEPADIGRVNRLLYGAAIAAMALITAAGLILK